MIAPLSPTADLEITSVADARDAAHKTVSHLIHERVALAGGATYAALFPHWVALRPDVSKTSFYPADERMVPFDDHRSNWGSIYQTFLSPLGKRADKSHHAGSADQYYQLLSADFNHKPIVFDTIFLAPGLDGHVASLFAGGSYWSATNQPVIETCSPLPPIRRISLSPEVIAAAHTVVIVVLDEKKRSIVDRMRSGDESLPVVKICLMRSITQLYLNTELY